MKMTRKLIPALVMLLVSAIMLSTASYAWFASNSHVEATDMQVKVTSDAKFLEISNALNGEYSNSASPVNKETVTALELVHADIDGAAISWYTADGKEAGKPDKNTDSITPVDSEDLSNYARAESFFVRMSSGSQSASTNLKVSGISVSGSFGVVEGKGFEKALRVLIVCGGKAQIWTNENGTFVPENGAEAQILLSTVPFEAQEIQIYIYFDGESSVAFTDNVNTEEIQKSISVTVSFTAN